jgi:glycosyltransferase involved in cell wall biosynthesis
MTNGNRKSIAVISTVHETYDTRIFYKQIPSLRENYDVVYLSPMSGPPEEDFILALPKSRSKVGRLATHLSLMRNLVSVRADLYLLHDPELLPLGVLLSLLGKRVVWDMHEDTYNDIKTKDYLSPTLRVIAGELYRLVQSLAARLLSGFILAEDAYGRSLPVSLKTCVVHNYPLLNRLSPFGEIAKNRESLVYIGSISRNRGIFQLLDVVDKLRHRLPGIRLLLIGPFVDPELEKEVRSYVFHRAIQNNVDIRGPIRNVDAYPLVAQCMVGLALLLPEPNFTSSLPTKMFEYMALGLPVIVSAFPLWEEIVHTHHVGASIDPTDTEGVADLVFHWLTHPDYYRELSDNARRAARRYSWETESRTLHRFVTDILST